MHFRRVLLVIALFAALGLCGCDSGPTMIRIHNAGDYDYQELEVGAESYGALGAGQYTEYRDFGTAYRYNYVRLVIDGDEFVLQPVDYVGEEPLGGGEFTYEIDVTDYDARALSITVRED